MLNSLEALVLVRVITARGVYILPLGLAQALRNNITDQGASLQCLRLFLKARATYTRSCPVKPDALSHV